MKKLLLILVFSFCFLEANLPYTQNAKMFYSSILASGLASGLSTGALIFKFAKVPVLNKKLFVSSLIGSAIGGLVSWASYSYFSKKYIPRIVRDIESSLKSFGDKEEALLKYLNDGDFDKFFDVLDGYFKSHIDPRIAAYDFYNDLYFKFKEQRKAAKRVISDSLFKDLSHEYKKVLTDCLPVFKLYKNALSTFISKIKQTPGFDIRMACVRRIKQLERSSSICYNLDMTYYSKYPLYPLGNNLYYKI